LLVFILFFVVVGDGRCGIACFFSFLFLCLGRERRRFESPGRRFLSVGVRKRRTPTIFFFFSEREGIGVEHFDGDQPFGIHFALGGDVADPFSFFDDGLCGLAPGEWRAFHFSSVV